MEEVRDLNGPEAPCENKDCVLRALQVANLKRVLLLFAMLLVPMLVTVSLRHLPLPL